LIITLRIVSNLKREVAELVLQQRLKLLMKVPPEATPSKSHRGIRWTMSDLVGFWSDSVRFYSDFGRIRSDSVGFGRIWSDLVGFGRIYEDMKVHRQKEANTLIISAEMSRYDMFSC
jgi:hypothetical protein